MPVDTQQLMSEAEKLGQLVAQHPAVERYKQAQRSVAEDADASRLLAEFDRQIAKLSQQEQTGLPVSDAQREGLESLQNKIVSHIKVKALNLAQVEFVDLLRRITQTIQKPLQESPDRRCRRRGGATRLRVANLMTVRFHRGKDAVARWLLKTEPGAYAWDDLARDKKTVWDGVANALALKHLRRMKKGDLAFIYHTGDEKAVVGIAEITSAPYTDPSGDEERLAVVDVKPKKKLRNAVTLAQIKTDKVFEGWDLLRIGRLSVVPVPDTMWERIETLSTTSPA